MTAGRLTWRRSRRSTADSACGSMRLDFLDTAADRLLLRRVGPSYTFMHRYLQDYLAKEWWDGLTKLANRRTTLG